MDISLYETKKKNDILDKVNNYINKTIDEYIDDDIYLNLAPFFSTNEIDSKNSFFREYKITPSTSLNSDEYKTISYLSLFFKEKIKYNVKEIERYIFFLGYPKESFVTNLCLDNSKEYECEFNNYISFDEYLELSDKQLFKGTVKENTFRYIDGFDLMFDLGGMK